MEASELLQTIGAPGNELPVAEAATATSCTELPMSTGLVGVFVTTTVATAGGGGGVTVSLPPPQETMAPHRSRRRMGLNQDDKGMVSGIVAAFKVQG
jgi:hypothetical protein